MGFQSFFCVYFSAQKSNMIDKCAAVRYNNTVHFMTQFNTSQQLSWIEVTLLREPKSVPR